MSDIHTNIHILRKQKKMTLEELGNKIGTTKQTIRRYETKEIKSIPYDKIVALANALDTTPSELMGWDNEPIEIDILDTPEHAHLVDKYVDTLIVSNEMRPYIDKLKMLPPELRQSVYAMIDSLSNYNKKE